MKEECLICGAPLRYLETAVTMECAICGKQEFSKTSCEKGHYVCNECHMSGLDEILSLCLNTSSKDPVQIIEELMKQPFCHMHGPEHHTMVGAALLTAYRNAGGELDLPEALSEMIRRGKEVPGGVCGFWGACGAGVSTGIYISIVTKSTPLAKEPWKLSNLMTARSLEAIGSVGGPRCCKRDSFLAIETAIDYTREHLDVEMDKSRFQCSFYKQNNQCIGKSCPYR